MPKTYRSSKTGVSEPLRAFTVTAHPTCQAQGNVALLPSIDYFHLIVVAARGERLAGLGQTNVHDALSFANIFQKLKEINRK